MNMKIIFLFVTALFVVGNTGKSLADIKTVSGEPDSTFLFQDVKRDKMKHLGDNGGYMKDVVRFLDNTAAVTGHDVDDFKEFIGNRYELRFDLDQATLAEVEIKIFSLIRKSHPKGSCVTFLRINSGEKLDLRDGENVGDGKLTTFSTTVNLHKGRNAIEIVEPICTNKKTGKKKGVNDSLFITGKIVF